MSRHLIEEEYRHGEMLAFFDELFVTIEGNDMHRVQLGEVDMIERVANALDRFRYTLSVERLGARGGDLVGEISECDLGLTVTEMTKETATVWISE